jgi:phytoene/squalene synthetase
MRRTDAPGSLATYSACAQRSSARVIRQYSTSFSMATRLLHTSVRPHVENIYGLVRVADEIVDGAAAEAGLGVDEQRELLDHLESDTELAIRSGYSTNLVVHAFATTARSAGIGPELTAPFFASMRRDLDPAPLSEEEVRRYIHGSAEVVGLMCLRVFLADCPPADHERARLEGGARRLGSAFQKINFLRDLDTDWTTLGRNYFPGFSVGTLSEDQKLILVADIDADLRAAADVIPALPPGCRKAVAAAHDLFQALNDRIRATPADSLLHQRPSVPAHEKARILIRNVSPASRWTTL